MKRRKVELLSPAGNKEGFYGAIHAGADAVYLGGDKFGARAYADNFTTDELVECIRYAHIWGRRVYLTVNTLVKDREWEQLYEYIFPFYEAGLDGVIIQDLGVFLYLKEHFPGMELHVSTQMTLTGSYGAAYMKELGACRIVPARELSLSEIKKIKEDTGLEIEAFIHGAMCYCYSGQCLFSSMLGGRSGNRGRCAQPCRLPYTVTTDTKSGKECYPLSLKDMCTIENIPELIGAGIDSFKIEGRMKKPEYAAGVTAIYRGAIDRYYEDPKGFQVRPEELEALSGLYIRSKRHAGYYHKHNGADMVTLDSPAYSGSDEELLGRIRRRYLEQKPTMPVEIYGRFKLGEPALVTLVWGECSVTVTGEVVESARKQPISYENVEKQLKKLGETCFLPSGVQVELDQNIFYPLQGINELRRQAVLALENVIIEGHGLSVRREAKGALTDMSCKAGAADSHADCRTQEKARSFEGRLSVNVRSLEQLLAVADTFGEDRGGLRRLYVDGDLLTGPYAGEVCGLLKELSDHTDIFAVLPYIVRREDKEYLEELLKLLKDHPDIYSGCMVRSLEGYAYLEQTGYGGEISADAGFYIWNQTTLAYWQDKLDSFCMPWELNAGEQKSLLSSCKDGFAEKIVYGHLPMMLTANCVVRTTNGCMRSPQTDKTVFLTDRYKKQFPVFVNCRHCMNIIYNSVPLSLHATMDRWTGITYHRLDFTVESREKTGQVLAYFKALTKKEPAVLPLTEYTTGHEKRGVE